MGAFWVREKYAQVLSPGTHASTFGGTPLACAVALKILDVIERERLDGNARVIGEFLLDELRRLKKEYPQILSDVRGFGLMIGIEFDPELPAFAHQEKSPAIQVVNRLHAAGVLTVPAANSVVRMLPALNLSQRQAEEGLRAIEEVVEELNG